MEVDRSSAVLSISPFYWDDATPLLVRVSEIFLDRLTVMGAFAGQSHPSIGTVWIFFHLPRLIS